MDSIYAKIQLFMLHMFLLTSTKRFDYYYTLIPLVKPFLTPEELRQTKLIVEQFSNGVGKDLQLEFLERFKNQRNWVCVVRSIVE